MTIELSDGVTARLHSADYGWLTTVTKSGQPVPKLVWFYFDGSDVFIYTHPGAAKVRHITSQPRVSLNLDSDGHGAGIIVLGGIATVDAEGFDPRDDKPYWRKYRDLAAQFGLMEAMGGYDTRLRLGIEQVWTTPSS